ncbi:MAG: hypothetical protein AABX73_01725 [Nanoarchaeota archaeon]
MGKGELGFTLEEFSVLKRINTPKKIQDFLNSLKINFEEKGDTCMSPRMVLREGKAHCIEGALLAAVALRIQGHPPLIVDMEASRKDFDHVIAVFRKDGFWGAIGKTNHAVLRYREPIYKNVRELVMSYFHEYFVNESGSKTLRTYSEPVDLSIFDKHNWMTSDEEVWFIAEHLTKIGHSKILTMSQIRNLRKADLIEREAGKLVEYQG